MRKQDSIINRDQFLELVFRQIEMIDDIEALQEIQEKVNNKLQMIGNQYGSARRIPSSQKQAQKEEQKRLEHIRKAERENEFNLSKEDSLVADYDLWDEDNTLQQRPSMRRSPSTSRNEKPTYQLKNFEWVYQEKFNKYTLALQEPPNGVDPNIFDTTQNQSQNTKLVQGSQVHLLIERYLNDPKKNEKLLLENDHLTPQQGQWIEFVVNTVKEYCKEYLHLNEMKTEKHIQNFLPKICLGTSTSHRSHDCSITGISTSQTNIPAAGTPHHNQGSKKVDVIFYNENRAVIIDWKFSPFSINDQVYMNDSNHFIDQIHEVKKFFNFQKEVTLLIVPLKKVTGLTLYELSTDEIDILQKEQINQEIFYQTKYKKMRNQILSKQYNVNQKCAIGEGKKQNLTIREYFISIIDGRKKNQLDYYGSYKNCYGKNPPANKEQFWALHVLLKELNKNNDSIIQLVYSKPSIQQKKIKGKSQDEVDFFTMNENNPLIMKKQNSSSRHKYRQNKSVLQFVLDQMIQQDFFEDEDEDDYSDYGDEAYQIIIQEKDDDEEFEDHEHNANNNIEQENEIDHQLAEEL